MFGTFIRDAGLSAFCVARLGCTQVGTVAVTIGNHHCLQLQLGATRLHGTPVYPTGSHTYACSCCLH